ncbi:hypothetical protein NOF55_21270 [Rhizobiaceae bacterium BDR2-2]|uniref:Acyl-CoA dehydrogenase n=1 Tax=Ectorhizobium quercum TaxID=2965071 RepID=A0AAE3N3P3_9HYPH|nr:hypothetical protein [Ectorhizobium quercum]MCX8999641.1 hypothetical protein [Ectorhizobium quercum]
MGGLLHSEDRFIRSVVRQIGSEEDALEVADRLVRNTDRADDAARFEAVSRSGLLAIATPAAFGGADVTNATLAEIVRRFAAEDPPEAHRLVSHFVASEIIRNAGGDAYAVFQRVAAGARLIAVLEEAGGGTVPLPARHAGGQGTDADGADIDVWFVILRRESSGLPLVRMVRDRRTGDDLLDGSFLDIDTSALPLVKVLSQLLKAGVFLGELERLKQRGDAARGERTVMIVSETISALVQRVGAALDLAQVSPSDRTITEAARLAEVLDHVRQRCARSPGADFDLSS